MDYDKKMVVAREPDRFIAYLPQNLTIEIDFNKAPALSFGPLAFWWSPRWDDEELTQGAPRDPAAGGPNRYQYPHPDPENLDDEGSSDLALVVYRDNWPNLLGGGGSVSDNTIELSMEPLGTGSRIKLQAFDSSGLPAGSSQILLDSLSDLPPLPIGARDASSRFVVVWNDTLEGKDSRSILVRRLGANGAPLANAMELASNPNVTDGTPWVAVVPGGDAVVAWTERDPGANRSSIWLRAISLVGKGPAAAMVVQGEEGWSVHSPQVACGPGGDCLLAWTARNLSGDDVEIWHRAFRLDAPSVGTDFLSDDVPAVDKWLTALTNDLAGEFELRWHEIPEDPSGDTIAYSMRFDSLGYTIAEKQEVAAP